MKEVNMASIPNEHFRTCPRCGSALVSLEWDERLNASEVQDLWHCWQCQGEFITMEACGERERSAAEVTKPFFTSLVME
jgi:uncharacterized protein with PIN domain